LIRVRRAGLVSFAVKLISILTGLAFVVLITSNLTAPQYALWNLVSATLGYVLFPNFIVSFWATRARARGSLVAKTVLLGSVIISAALTVAFIFVSLLTSGFLAPIPGGHSNFFYFLLSSPQVLLYTLVVAFEGMLWGSSPEKQSYGFVSFEVAKVLVGLSAFTVFHLRLEGAIFAVIVAQLVQVVTILFLTRNDFAAPVSMSTLRMWFRSGWPSVFQNLYPVILNLDLTIVAFFIPRVLVAISSGSSALVPANSLLIDYFGTARVISSVVGYSDGLAYGLYPSILSGDDPKQKTSYVLELQLMIIGPMLIGAIVLGHRLLVLFNPTYTPGTLMIIPLAFSYVFYSLRPLVEGVIMGSEKVDIGEKMSLKQYFQSKLFLISKIDLLTSAGYIFVIAAMSAILARVMPMSVYGLVLVGIAWAVANLGRSIVTFAMKLTHSNKIARPSLPSGTVLALVVSSLVFGTSLYLVNQLPFLAPALGKVHQAAEVIVIGAVGMAIYTGVLSVLSNSAKKLIKDVFAYIF
jgi:O-antigen/teichoic acid export membrane protein